MTDWQKVMSSRISRWGGRGRSFLNRRTSFIEIRPGGAMPARAFGVADAIRSRNVTTGLASDFLSQSNRKTMACSVSFRFHVSCPESFGFREFRFFPVAYFSGRSDFGSSSICAGRTFRCSDRYVSHGGCRPAGDGSGWPATWQGRPVRVLFPYRIRDVGPRGAGDCVTGWFVRMGGAVSVGGPSVRPATVRSSGSVPVPGRYGPRGTCPGGPGRPSGRMVCTCPGCRGFL